VSNPDAAVDDVARTVSGPDVGRELGVEANHERLRLAAAFDELAFSI
jgi:hypothetical protein